MCLRPGPPSQHRGSTRTSAAQLTPAEPELQGGGQSEEEKERVPSDASPQPCWWLARCQPEQQLPPCVHAQGPQVSDPQALGLEDGRVCVRQDVPARRDSWRGTEPPAGCPQPSRQKEVVAVLPNTTETGVSATS